MDMLPEKIGLYTILYDVAVTSTATIYKAQDTTNQRIVAIKLFHSETYSDPTIRARYQREMQLIASLQHTAIVPVFEFGEFSRKPYIVMDWMPGGSLADLLSEQILAPNQALDVLERLAAALDDVHSLGIVHGDLKPSNVLFDAHGLAYVSDFGMLKLAEATHTEGSLAFLGPPAYISPEQARQVAQLGTSLDSRSDIYMLGVVVFQMLTGQLPYSAETSLGYAIQKVAAPLSTQDLQRFGMSPAFADAIQRALSPDPDQRFGSAREFVEALKNTSVPAAAQPHTPPTFAPPSRIKPVLDDRYIPQREPSRRSPLLRVGVVFLVVALVIVGLYAVLCITQPQVLAQAGLPYPLAPYPSATLTAAPTATPTPAVSPGLTATSPPPPTPTRTPLPTATTTPQPVAVKAPPGPTQVTVSESLATTYTLTSLDTLFQIAGKFNVGFQHLLDANDKVCDSRLPFGVNLVIPGEPASAFTLFPAEIGLDTLSQMQTQHTLECMQGISALGFSPNQQLLAAAMGNAVYIWQVGTWRPAYLLRGHIGRVTSLDFSPDSAYLVTGSDDTAIRLWSLKDGSQVLALYEHTRPVTAVAFISASAGISISLDGRMIRWSTDGAVKDITIPPSYSLAVSPDKSKVAAGYQDGVSIFNSASLELDFSFESPSPVNHLAFSPDGKLLASENTLWHIEEKKVLYQFPDASGGVIFTADGQALGIGGEFWRVANGQPLLSLFDTAQPRPRLNFNQFAFTPDASLFAWGNDTELTIWGLPLDFTQPPPLSTQKYRVASGDTLFSIANQFQVKLSALRALNNFSCTNPLFASQVVWIPDAPQARLETLPLPSAVINAGNVLQLKELRQMDLDCVIGASDIALSPDNRFLVSGSALWDLSTSAVLVQARDVPRRLDHTPEINLNAPIVVLSPDLAVAAVRLDKEVLLWDIATGKVKQSLVGHKGVVTGMAFSPDGQLLASGTGVDEQSIRLWDLTSHALVMRLDGYVTENLLFSPDSQMLYQVGNDALRVYRVGEQNPYRTVQGIGTDFAFSPDMSQVAYTVCMNGSGSRCQASIAKIYSISAESLQSYTSNLAPTLQNVVFSPDGAALAAASGSGVVVWNVADSTVRFSQRLLDSNQPMDWVKFSPRGDLLLAYEAGKRLHFWDLSSGELVYTIPDIRIDRLTWAPDGSFLAILSAGTISLWGIAP